MMGPALGSYTIIEKIGAGGMGVVYRARDERLGRDVALKVLPAEMLADHTAQARLLNEARTASVLNHPHICTIYEVGEANGQTYIALEHIEGLPLSQRIPSGGLPILTLLRYAIQIADALAHAHERGIVHRDLKSSNVMITLDGRAKVLYFGVSNRLLKDDLDQATRSRESLTGTGTVGGTLHYLSPEVLRGELADVRSDLWALGVLVYEMATGGLPFQGQTGYELSSAILSEAPASLPLRLPAGLRAIIERCLAKERGERYQRAGEVRAALEAIQSDTASAPLPAAVAAAPSRRVFSRRWLQATGAAIVAGLVILLAVNVGGWRQRLLGRAAPTRIRSLAVLPLENLSRDPEQGYFADGMTEALITDLAQISALRVISRTSVMQYRGTKKPLSEVAR
jgi:serine/threonine protein kinase